MPLLSVGRTKFYNMINRGEIAELVRLSEKDFFWYASFVKDKVEEHKNSDIVAA